jgi:hypothetical protein
MITLTLTVAEAQVLHDLIGTSQNKGKASAWWATIGRALTPLKSDLIVKLRAL